LFSGDFRHPLLRSLKLLVIDRVGPAGLVVDRFSRRVGFARAAKAQQQVIDPDVYSSLEAYARGVNAGRTHGSSSRAHEFVLLGAQPTPWTALDTLAITKLLSFSLCANWDSELVRLKVLSTDGPEALRVLDGSYPAWYRVKVDGRETR
jgi:penicillin amidase